MSSLIYHPQHGIDSVIGVEQFEPYRRYGERNQGGMQPAQIDCVFFGGDKSVRSALPA
jgi:hypothetical protein